MYHLFSVDQGFAFNFLERFIHLKNTEAMGNCDVNGSRTNRMLKPHVDVIGALQILCYTYRKGAAAPF